MKPLGRVPLERAFSKLGLASRTQARQWITAGRIRVDGKKIVDPLLLVVPEKIRLELDGQPLKKNAWRLVMLHKPRGLVTTRSDEKGRPTVFSLLKASDGYLHPVGRLDMATSGLLLLTNDTRLSDWLTDPANAIIRVYLVTVEGKLTPEHVTLLEKGIEDRTELLKAQKVIIRKASNRETHLTVELNEGKNREIRRIFEAIGHDVTALKRVAFGGLQLGTLAAGSVREISYEELSGAFSKLPPRKIV
jgi:23S rRNA pseudouridine2605 synthase